MNSIARQIPTIMGEALEIESPAERESYLQRVCGEDAELRHRIDVLLRDHVQAGDFLEQPAFAPTLITQQVAEAPGTQIGPYKLREQLGEGGMGIVYVADQMEPVRRRVALKIVKPGMDTREVLARFEAERQALAVMNHPHIAKILDGGATETGRPYFVMELVKGISITEYCDRHKLSVRQRLELFILVCQAVQHAHQKGVIHRDLKPSNVLVELHDVTPVPKVIDFGIAKAINQQLSQHTIYTQFAQLIGTPLYMSPEQAQLSGLDVDTRSDVYSLGVMLYELLTGTTPFDTATLTRGGLEEMRRIIREVEPLRPSHKISTLHAELLSTVSDRRQADARKLSLTMRRELDWIVMRAMEKDRNRRYESASAFAADVQRYLDDEPVAACPPSSAYRLRKFARRNKTTLLTAITVSTALLVGTAVSIWQAFEATNARKLADERLVLADERLENEKQARADAVKQRKQASANLQQALDAVDQMLLRVADDRLAAIPGAEPVRQELFQDALKFYEAFFQQAPDDPQLRISTAKAWARVGNLHDFLGNPTKAQEARQEAIERWETLHAERSDDPQIQAALAEAYRDFGECEHWTRHRFASAKPALEHAISLWQDLQRRFPDTLDYQWNASRAETVLGTNYQITGRVDLAEHALRHVVDVQRELWNREAISSKSHWSLGSSLMFLGLLLTENKKRDDEAEPLFVEAVRRGEEVLASDPQSVPAAKPLVGSMYEYGRFLESRNRVAEAEKHYRRAVEVGQLLPRVNPRAIGDIFFLPRAQVALADLLARDGRHSEALGIYRAAGDLLRPGAVLPERNGYLNSVYRSADQGMLSSLEQLARGGHLDEARKFCEELIQGGGSGSVAILSQDLAIRAWERIGELDRASQHREKLAKELDQKSPDGLDQRDRESIAHVIFALGDNDFHRRNYDRALPLFDRAIRINPGESEAFDHRGQIYLARGENEKALADLDESIRLGAPYGFLTFNCRALAYFRLAHYSRSLADLTEAVKLRSGDARTLNAIDPSEIAACSDAGFRKTYIAWFEQAFTESKSSSEARVSHAALLGELRQFDSLPDDLAAILADASASPHVLYQAALLALQAGDQSHYREFCRLLSSRDSIPLDATKCHFIAWTAAVASHALDDYERAITAARYALTLEPTDRTALLDLGGILYRARKLDEALEYLTKSDSTPTMTKTPPEYAHFFLAMTHHKLGHNAEARQWFGQSIAETERMLADGKTASGEPLSWNRRLTLELLRAEATALFREAPAKSPPKTDAPESAPPK